MLRIILTVGLLSYVVADNPHYDNTIPEESGKQFSTPEDAVQYAREKMATEGGSFQLALKVVEKFNKDYIKVIARNEEYFTLLWDLFYDIQFIDEEFQYNNSLHEWIIKETPNKNVTRYFIVRFVTVLREGHSNAALHCFEIAMYPISLEIMHFRHYSPEFQDIPVDDYTLELKQWFKEEKEETLRSEEIIEYKAQNAQLREPATIQNREKHHFTLIHLQFLDATIIDINNTDNRVAFGDWHTIHPAVSWIVSIGMIIASMAFSCGFLYIFVFMFYKKYNYLPMAKPDEEEVRLADFELNPYAAELKGKDSIGDWGRIDQES